MDDVDGVNIGVNGECGDELRDSNEEPTATYESAIVATAAPGVARALRTATVGVAAANDEPAATVAAPLTDSAHERAELSESEGEFGDDLRNDG